MMTYDFQMMFVKVPLRAWTVPWTAGETLRGEGTYEMVMEEPEVSMVRVTPRLALP